MLKFAKLGYDDALWNDYKTHSRVVEVFEGLTTKISDPHVPNVHWFVEPKLYHHVLTRELYHAHLNLETSHPSEFHS